MTCVTAYRGTFTLMFSFKKKRTYQNIILAILLVIRAPASDISFASRHYTQEKFMMMDAFSSHLLLTVEKPNHWLGPFGDRDILQ